MVIGAVVGGLVGAAAVSTAHRTDEWLVLPAVLVWGCLLVAAGVCDAATQRIPTVLVRAGTAAVAVLFTVGFSMGHNWRSFALAAVTSVTSAVTLLVCWRLLGVGRGDVRLALLGGLGLGGADGRGVLVGLLVFAAVVVGCVVQQRSLGGTKTTTIPLGPALAAGFISAAALSWPA